jgi:hypothetical protein
MNKEKKLIEKKVRGWINLLAEQDAPAGVTPNVPAKASDVNQGPGPGAGQQAAQQPAQPTPNVPAKAGAAVGKERGTKLQYLSTIDMFTSKNPPNSAEWRNEVKQKPQFIPLTDARIVNHLKSFFPTLKAKAARAARYSDYQFRIIMEGELKAEAEIKIATTGKDKIEASLESIVISNNAKLSPKGNAAALTALKENKIPMRISLEDIRKWSKTPEGEEPKPEEGEETETSSFKDGEKVKQSELDKMIDMFGEGQLIEKVFDKSDEELKQEAWAKIKPAFSKWFAKEIIADNEKSRVEARLKSKQGREQIKQLFAKDAEHMPDIDREALKAWLGHHGEEEPVSPGQALKNLVTSTEQFKGVGRTPTEKQIDMAPEPRPAKEGADPKKHRYYHTLIAMVRTSWEVGQRVAERFAKAALTEKNPKDEFELYKLALDKTYLSSKVQRESLDLHSYLKSLLLEKKATDVKKTRYGQGGEELESGKGGNIVATLNDALYDKWFANKGIAAPTDNRVFKGNVFEWFSADSATFRPEERNMDVIEKTQVEITMKGDIVMEVELWFDARMGENGETLNTWTFRMLDNGAQEKSIGGPKWFKTPGTPGVETSIKSKPGVKEAPEQKAQTQAQAQGQLAAKQPAQKSGGLTKL